MCKGNETQCTMMSTTSSDCHPVLRSEMCLIYLNQYLVMLIIIAAAVSVPRLLVVGTGVCLVAPQKQIERKQR